MFLMTWTFLRTTGRSGYFVECPSLYWTFYREVEVLFSSHCVKGTYYQHHLLLLMLTSLTWLKVYLPGFPAVTSPFSPFPYYPAALERSHFAQEWKYAPLPWGWSVFIIYLEYFCMGNLSPLSFIYSVMFVSL